MSRPVSTFVSMYVCVCVYVWVCMCICTAIMHCPSPEQTLWAQWRRPVQLQSQLKRFLPPNKSTLRERKKKREWAREREGERERETENENLRSDITCILLTFYPTHTHACRHTHLQVNMYDTHTPHKHPCHRRNWWSISLTLTLRHTYIRVPCALHELWLVCKQM